MLKIDGHFHVDFCGFSAEDIISYLDKKKIEQCWLLTWEEKTPPIPSLFEHLSIEDLIEAYRKYPDRIVPFYAPDPNSERIKDAFNKYINLGVKGCGELKVTYKWADSIIENYLKVISDLGIPLVFHMESPRKQYLKISNNKFEKIFEEFYNGALNGVIKYYLSSIAKFIPFASGKISKGLKYFPGYLFDFVYLEKRIKQFVDIIFIGHGPCFWNNIAEYQSPKYIHQRGKINKWGVIDKLLEEYDNFYCDISGKSGFNALSRDKFKGKQFIEKHSKKIIFGTDNTSYNFEGLLDSYKLPKEKLQDIYYNNAKTIIP